MAKCVVPACSSRSSNLELDFYNIPRAPILFERWCSSLKIERYGEHSSMRVCCLHFLETDFWVNHKGQSLLKRSAVPRNISAAGVVLNGLAGKSKSSTTSRGKRIAKKGAKNSTKTVSTRKTVPVVKKVTKPSKKQFRSINGNSSNPENEISTQHIIIVRGSETFSVVLEKYSKPNKQPAKDAGTWKAKHVARLADCDVSKSLTGNTQVYSNVEQMDKTDQSPGGIPSLPVAESVPEKSAVISGSKVMPTPSGPASLEEGSILKEGNAVSESKVTSPAPSKVWKPHHLYRECKECKVVLTPKKIGPDFIIFLCPSEECTFPLGTKILYKYLYRKLPNNELQQCARDNALTLKEIVAIVQPSDSSRSVSSVNGN